MSLLPPLFCYGLFGLSMPFAIMVLSSSRQFFSNPLMNVMGVKPRISPVQDVTLLYKRITSICYQRHYQNFQVSPIHESIANQYAIFLGLILTAVIIEWFGRKKTMAIEFSVYSLFMFLLYFCLER